MYYKKVETYSFSVPREFKAYLAFKQNLKDAGISFVDEGGNMHQVVTVNTHGRFNVDEDGTILAIEE